jgi:hypothetical protein
MWIDKTLGLAWYKKGNLTLPFPSASVQTVSRGSALWLPDSSGNWSSVASGNAGVNSLGQYIWEGRINLCGNCFDFTAPGWTLSNGQISATMPSPIAGFNAQKLADGNTTNTQHAVSSNGITVTANTVYTASCFIYSGNSDYPIIRLTAANGAFTSTFFATLTLANGTLATGTSGTATLIAAGVIPYGNGWFRVWVAGIVDATSTQIKPAIYLNGGNAYAGVVGNGTYATGVQLELGLGPSPIIPTTTASSASRAAEADTLVTTNLPAFGSAYTIFGEATPEAPTTFGVDQVLMQVDDGTGNNRFSIRRQASGAAAIAHSTASGSAVAVSTATAWAQGTTGKIAASQTSGRQAVSFNGGAIATGSGSLPNTPTAIRDGSIQSGAAQWNGPSRKLGLWCTQALTDAQLQAIAA